MNRFWAFVERKATTIGWWLLFLLLLDWSSSLLACHIRGQKQQTSQCAEEGYGIAQSFTYRSFSWFEGWIDAHEHFIVAASTVAIAIFTLTLWQSTRGLLAATNDSIKLSRSEYISTHRPRITVRRVTFKIVKEGSPLVIELRIVNTGETVAHLLQINATILFGYSELPPVPPHDEGNTVPYPDTALDSGVYMNYIVTMTTPLSEFDVKNINATSIILIGYVRYADDDGIVRQMAFGRSHSRGHFNKMQNDEYEYTD